MFNKTTRTERILILSALLLATLIVLILFVSTLGKYIDTLKPTPTVRSLPPIAVPSATSLPTLRPTSTPLPTRTPPVLPSPTP